MRKLLIGLVAVAVILVAAVLVVPSLIDWNGYKPEIQAAVKQATGRNLALDGDIGLSLLPSPSLSVDKVALANIPDGTVPEMARLESLRVHVALLPLLTGKVHVTSVTLVRPTIVLERVADGRANWEFPGGSADSGPGSAGGGSDEGGGGPGVALDEATIEDGTLIYRDAATGSEHRIEKLNATVSAGGLRGPFEADGSFTYQGLPVTVDASVGALAEGRTSPVRVTLAAAEKSLTASVNGSLDAAKPAFAGEARVEAADLGDAVRRIAAVLGSAPPPVAPGQAMSLTAQVAGSAEAVRLDNMALAVGESRLQGSAALTLAEVPMLDAKLTGNRLDLDALLPGGAGSAAAGGSAARSEAPSGDTPEPSDPGFALPTGVGGSLDIAIDAVQYKGAPIRRVRLAGDLVDGAANLRLATAQLPGGTEVTLTGTALSADGEPQFVGRVEAVSDNLRGTLDWAGVKVEGVPADRLRKAAVHAAVDATPRKVEVTDWTMELDATKAKGGLTLVLRQRPAFGLSLEVDRINLDAYRPAAGSGGTARPAAAGSQPSPAPAAGDNPLAALSSVDANVDIRVGEATAMGVPVRDARVDALLQNGTLTLRDVTVADLGGARAKLGGVLRDAAGKPSVDMDFDVTVVNVDRFARLLSTESPIPAKQLGQVSLKGSAAGDMQDVKVDVKLTAAGGSFGVKGTARPLEATPKLDLALSLAHPDANKLAAVLAPGALDGVGPLGALNGDGSIGTRDDGRYSLRLGLTVAGGSIGLIGNADVFAPVPDVDMAVETSHPDAVRLIRIVAPKYRPAGTGLGGMHARTRFQGPVDNLRLFETELGLGAIKATGEGGIDARGERPAVKLALAVNRVEVDPWLPPSAPKPSGAAPAAPVPAGPAAGREWSRERIDMSALSAVDAGLTAKIESIEYGSYVVDNAVLDATLKDGVLSVAKLAGGMFGGSFDLTAQLADRDTPSAALTVKVRDADVRKAASAAAGTDMVSGILSYDTDLKTQGGSEFELVSALAGSGSFSVRDGVVKGFDLKAFSDQLKSLDRAPDFVQLAQRALSGGETAFSALSGTYTVSKGVLRSKDIRLTAEAATGEATATVDLPPRQMDVRSQFRLSEHPNAPPVGVRLTGPLDNPRRIFEIEEMQAYVIQRLVERGALRQFDKNGKVQDFLKGLQGGSGSGSGGGPQTQPGAAPTPPVQSGDAPAQPQQPVKPEEAVKDLLKGLLNKN